MLAIAVIFAFHRTDQPSENNENEIALQIQLDLKENVGLLISDSDIDGEEERGGISNADKTMLKKDDLIYWSIDKQHYETAADTVELVGLSNILDNGRTAALNRLPVRSFSLIGTTRAAPAHRMGSPIMPVSWRNAKTVSSTPLRAIPAIAAAKTNIP